jgi:alpha-1,6-mannosyltransferase
MRREVVQGMAGSMLVLVGGLITSPLPASTPLASAPFLEALRETPAGRMLGLAIVVGGLGLLGYAWLHLLPLVRGHGLGAARSNIAGLMWSLPLLAAPPLFSRDGWSYAAQGYLTGKGLSPYVHTPEILRGPIVEAVDPRWMDTPAPYGPVPLVWGAVASHATADPWLLVIADRVFALVGVALLAYAVPRLARYAGADAGVACWLVVPTPLMMAHAVGGLHNDVTMVGLMAVALVVAIERHWAWGAALGGLAAAVKVPGGLVCVGVILISLGVRATMRDRFVRTAGVGVVAVATLLAAGILTGLGVGWIRALGVPGEVLTPLSLTTDLGTVLGSVSGLLGMQHLSVQFLPALHLLGSLAALGLAAWVLFTRPTGVRPAAIASVSAVMLAVTILSPVVHPWYAFWALPLIAATRLTDRARNAVAAAALLLALSAPLDSSLEGMWIPVIMTVGLVAVVAAALLGKLRTLPVELPNSPRLETV